VILRRMPTAVSVRNVPTSTVAPTSKAVSVRDIQGYWCEKSTDTEWTVDGIVVEISKGSKTQKRNHKSIVLTDGPAGIEWGNGNLIGSLEDGCLVWRNRRGEASYYWQRADGKREAKRTEPKPVARKSKDTLYPMKPLPTKISLQTTKEDSSPRSTNSATSNETAAVTAGMAGLMMNAGHHLQSQSDEATFGEVAILLEMAHNRLMAGDAATSLQFFQLAQQVKPPVALFGGKQ